MIVDGAIVAVVGSFVWRGMRRGLLVTLAGWVGFLAAVAVAVFGFRLVARPLEAAGMSTGAANLTGALVLFMGVIAGAMFGGRVLTRAIRPTTLGKLNTAAGGALSGIWALSMVTVVLLATTVIPLSDDVEAAIDGSTLGAAIIDGAPSWMDTLARTDLRSILRVFTPDERKVAIVATSDFERVPDAERALFDLANQERRARGLAPLGWDGTLARAARVHAADMYRLGFFSHVSPTRGDVPDRFLLVGARFTVAGENLVLAPSISSAHALLMASDRHRAQILGERFARLGVGVMAGRQGLVVAQDFAG